MRVLWDAGALTHPGSRGYHDLNTASGGAGTWGWGVGKEE